MKISSPAFQNGASLPVDYTADGRNVNPPLVITEVPVQAKTLALITHDPDAPGGDWTHWTLWNIPAQDQIIPEDTIPVGAVAGQTDFGDNRYGGADPPSGTHRYIFTIYALNKLLAIAPSTNRIELLQAIRDSVIEEATIMATYLHKL